MHKAKVNMASNIFRRQSLKARVTLFTLAVFLIGVWSLAFYASRILREDMQRSLADQQFSTVTYMAAGVNDDLADRLKALEKAARGITPAMLSHPSVLQARLEDQLIFQTLFNGGTFVTRPDGIAVASIPLSAERFGVNYLDRDFMGAALKQGKTAIGRPVVGKRLSGPIFVMVTPIHDAHAKVVGALAGVIDLSKPNFLDKLTENRYGKTGGFLLVDSRNRMVVSATDKNTIMRVFPAPGINPLIDRFISGYEGSAVFVNPRGEEVLASAKGVPVAGWYVTAQLPTKEAFAPIVDMQQRLLLAAILFTLLAGGLIGWLTLKMLRRQLSPMLVATRTLSALTTAQRPLQPLPITSQDEIGELIGGFNSLLDTLEQRKALLRQILDTSSVAIFLIDTEGRIIQANQRMADMFGYSLDALLGSEYVELVHPTERNNGRQTMQALLDSEIEAADLERLFVRADHTEFWGHLTGKRFYDANGEERGLVVVIVDITDRKHAESVLQRSEARYRSFLADLPLGIVITQDGLIKYVNQAMVEMIGYPESELLGHPFLPLVDDADRPRLKDLHQRRMRGEEVEKSYMVGMVRKNGELRQWQGYVNTIDWDDKPSGLGSFIDITERKQMEEQVRQLAFHDALTGLPNRRLLNDRLLQAMAASKRSACFGALMFLDLDNFKPLNDLYGHEVGDLLLIEAAERLKGCVREIDTVARFGGDEFVVVLSELDSDRSESATQAGVVAEKIRMALEKSYRLTIKDDGKPEKIVEHHCSVSIGVALLLNHEASPSEIIKWADTAMYDAKGAGRNLIRFHDHPQHKAPSA
jgi:diguanylate cyclase (GGDEF)-like protein/PAS domain S-box-containing protein